jgi:predicted metal-dependent phosphoesterase TrpH
MIQHGLDGIEVYHPSHNDFTTKHYHSIASQYWLLETGGSDFHGTREYDEGNFGKITVPYNVVESINYLRHKK